jgi:hypothetical protein
VDRKLPGLIQYSAEQMFFINYGQIWCSKMTDANALSRILTGVHSPGQFRYIFTDIREKTGSLTMGILFYRCPPPPSCML